MNQSRQAQREYVQAVLDLYVALPATRHAPGRQDRRLAAALYERGIPLGLVPRRSPARCCSQDLAWRRRPTSTPGGMPPLLPPRHRRAQELPARPQIRRLPLLQARALHETQTRSEVDRWSENFTFNWSVTSRNSRGDRPHLCMARGLRATVTVSGDDGMKDRRVAVERWRAPSCSRGAESRLGK